MTEESRWTQFKGDLKEKWGKFTDNDLQEIAGHYDKIIGKAEERYGDKKSELMKWADHLRSRRRNRRRSNSTMNNTAT